METFQRKNLRDLVGFHLTGWGIMKRGALRVMGLMRFIDMRSLGQPFVALMVMACLVFSFVGCTKVKELLPQHSGQGENGIYKMSPGELDGHTFLLQTGEAKRVENTSVADIIDVSEEELKAASYPFVEYSIPQEMKNLLGDFEFIGRPHHTYQMRIELDDENLWLYAVAPERDISLQHSHVMAPVDSKAMNSRTVSSKAMHSKEDKAGGDTYSKDLYKIPVMGLPVTYMAVEVLKDMHSKATNRTTEYVVLRKDMANHVQLNHHGKSQFKYLEKLDVYPADLFEGDWYFAETIVATQAGEEGMQGFSLAAADTTLAESTKIRFVRSEDKIRGINVNIDDRVDETDEVNFQTVIEIPVSWKEYRMRPKGNTFAFGEEEIPDVNWRDKKFGKFNFNEILTAHLGAQFNNTSLNERKLVELQIQPDYRSYTIFFPRRNIRVRHSFMRAGLRTYKPKRAYKNDLKKFGYFTTTKKVLDTFEIARMEDLEELRFINRFDINQGKIVFHFTKTSPHHLRSVGYKAVESWNKVFAIAGTGVEIQLSDEDVNLGDLRYNAINIIESISGGGSGFGFGPSITDPQTGEIISATANLWSTPIRDYIIEFLRDYVRSELGLIDDKYLFAVGGMKWPSLKVMTQGQFQSINQEVLTPLGVAPMDMSLFLDIFNTNPQLGKVDIVHAPNKAEYIFDKTTEHNIRYEKERLKEAVAKHGKVAHWDPLFIKNFGREFYLGTTHASLIEELRASEECHPLHGYIKELKEANQLVNKKEHGVLLSCANKLLSKKMLGTLVHELGHNFGLRHNFMGSNDVDNFIEVDGQLVESSTVMEYPAFGVDRLTQPGFYDLAAIRYGYFDTVEAKDGQLVKLDSSQSIHVNMAAKGLQSKPYKFCTDEHASQYVGSLFSQYTNPMCALWDKGKTAEEVMDFTAAQYSVHMALENHRLEKIWPPSNNKLLDWGFLNAFRRFRYVKTAKLFYDHWRVELARFSKLGHEYLEHLTEEEFEAVMQEMSQSQRVGAGERSYQKIFNEFKPAADKAFSMLMDIAFMPNRYCGTRGVIGDFDIIELEEIRQQAYWNKDGVVVTNCLDPAAKEIIFENNKGNMLFEVGYYLNDLKFDMNPLEEIEPLDITGTLWDRLLAMSSLGQRSATSSFHRSRNFFPNFFDEPDKRSQIMDRVMDRLLEGVNPLNLKSTPIETRIMAESREELAKLSEEAMTQFVDENVRKILMGHGLAPEVIEEKLLVIKENKSDYKDLKNMVIEGFHENQIQAFFEGKRFVQFKHEKDLLNFFYSMLPKSLMVPGKSFENSQRSLLFSMSVTDQPEVIQKAAAKIAIGGGRFVVAMKSSTVAVQLIQKLMAVMDMKRSRLVFPEDSIVQETRALYDAFGETTMTFADYSAFMELLMEVLTRSPVGIKNQIESHFRLDLAIWGFLQGLDNGTKNRILNFEDMRVTYGNIASAVGSPAPFPFLLVKSERNQAFFDDVVLNNNKQFHRYMRDKDDYEAQEDLLSQIVLNPNNH